MNIQQLKSFLLEGTNVSVRGLAHESLLFAETNDLFENYRHDSESDRENGGNFHMSWIKYCDNVFLFDSPSRNKYGLHDPNVMDELSF